MIASWECYYCNTMNREDDLDCRACGGSQAMAVKKTEKATGDRLCVDGGVTITGGLDLLPDLRLAGG